jgi:hypothetical protein
MAQLVGAVSALSLSLGIAQAAQSDTKPADSPCATGEHCGTSNQIKGETHDGKAGGNDVSSWSWGGSQGGGQHNAIGSATGGAGAGKTHDRKAGGNGQFDDESPKEEIGSATTGAGAGKVQDRKAGGDGNESHQLKIDAPAGAQHSVKTIAPPTPH